MNTIRTFACTALLASLAACGGNDRSASSASTPSTPSATTAPSSTLGRIVEENMAEARKKLATENLSLNGKVLINTGKDGDTAIFGKDDGTLPKAEISPKGDLLIEGKTVATTPEQRAMLLQYRQHVIAVAEGGMEIGVQGADLAAKALGEAAKGLFSGKSEEEITQSIEAEAAGIKAAAAKLCERLPPMMEAQQKLAASLPEFKPYATMTKDDIDDCMKNSEGDGKHAAGLRSEVREEVRNAVRESVREEVRQVVRNDGAQEPDAKPAH
ncbi:YggN family protein [Lysobacter solisilvae (ex Woo and Kim 2020)]|uniref:DUF2884 family protein n=1 Tax=Agrilutibacter terrestris TaxID=2865112 RepID=A0A7H0FXS6_9GAMM|nr:hypothetical protein [Lysobacter terrestris]QNP40842.1 hypothetical protein H8B22_00810 [Lysobacter terrestris]